jgi:hypothetical protein
MATPALQPFEPGGYHYLPAVYQYSGGVVAAPGYEIQRVRLHRPLPLAQGLSRVAAHLAALDRPITALCACELRSPEPFTEASFEAFNRQYVGTLAPWGLCGPGWNAVARSNVCPALHKPAGPSLYAFSYTVPCREPAVTFVVAGSAEAPEGRDSYLQHAIALGDASDAGLCRKARWVLEEMQRRMSALGVSWPHVTATHLYTVRDPHPLLADELIARGAAPGGLTWHWARPPVAGLEFEMDLRGIRHEHVLA